MYKFYLFCRTSSVPSFSNAIPAKAVKVENAAPKCIAKKPLPDYNEATKQLSKSKVLVCFGVNNAITF